MTIDPTEVPLPIPGKEVIFRHMDDPEVPWQLCRAQQNADGSTSYVREKWFAFSPDPQYLCSTPSTTRGCSCVVTVTSHLTSCS